MPAKSENTYQLKERELVLYQRPTSKVWQCRFTVDNKKWYCKSTGECDIQAATSKAYELLIGARLMEERDLPIVSKKFDDIAKLAIKTMEDNKDYEKGSASFPQYIKIINEYLVPFFGKTHIDSITPKVLLEFDVWRADKLKKVPSNSTIRTQNAALNRVFKEAEERGYVHKKQIPYLDTKGRESDSYPTFQIIEINAILAKMPDWIVNTKHSKSVWRRNVLHDYVRVLIETGARPGKELLNLKWKNIRIKKVQSGGVVTVPDLEHNGLYPNDDPEFEDLEPIGTKYDTEGNPLCKTEYDVTVHLDVYGKTKDRTANGFGMTYKVLQEIVKRNYTGDRATTVEKLTENMSEDYVFRSYWNLDQDYKAAAQCFNHMFERFLDEHNLLKDPKTGRNRVFYSIRSLYTTESLNKDRVNPRDLSKQLGNSIKMIEKFYDRATGADIAENVRATNAHKAFFSPTRIPDIYNSKRAKAAA